MRRKWVINMGSGEWRTDVYSERERVRRASGKSAFDYDHTLRSRPSYEWVVHPTLDPLGVRSRESRDSDEHPTSLAIATYFDVTGSMGGIPVILQKNLAELNGLLVRKGLVEHPQIMFGAIGDATCDRVPLQVGQFESDNRMDDQLGKLVLEGGGGPYITESYELAMYFMSRHTDIDCWNKRRKKGYLFMIGDEQAYPRVKSDEVSRIIGDTLQEDIPITAIVRELRQRYEPFYILPKDASGGGSREILGFWRRLLGQNVIELDNPEAVSETIALQIGINEGTTDLDTGEKHLRELGVPKSTISSVRRALVRRDAPAKGSISLPGLREDSKDEPTTRRL